MLVLAALLSLATPGSGAPQVAVAPAALVDRFIAALPREAERTTADVLGKQQIAMLEALNPGREAELHKILDRLVACQRPAIHAATIRVVRKLAASLGEERLAKLTLFYEKEQVPFGRLASALDRGETLSAPDRAEFERMLATYPLQDWLDAMSRAHEFAMTEDQDVFDAITKCSLQKDRDMADAGLRLGGARGPASVPAPRL